MISKNSKLVLFIGVVICLVLVSGIVLLNKSDRKTAISEELEDNMDIEKEKVNIPGIKKDEKKDKEKNNEIENDKSNNEIEVKMDENKEINEENTNSSKPNKINPITKSTKEKLPEEMEKPITEPKPINSPEPTKEEIKDKEKPPTITKEEKPKEEKGGTGEDGVIRDLKGNPTGLKPAENVEEIKGSDLLPDGEKMGEGDKF